MQTQTNTQNGIGPETKGVFVKRRREGQVVIATLDNPPYGLVTAELLDELNTFVDEVERDESIGAVVFHGAHPTRFLGHFDVFELLEMVEGSSIKVSQRQADIALRTVRAIAHVPGASRAIERSTAAGLLAIERYHDLLLRINRIGATFIAAMNGSAMGGGLELALACDLRYIADGDHYLSPPEILIGIIPGLGGTQRIARAMGTAPALELILEGGMLSPHQALAAGLVNRVVEPDRLLDEALTTARRLARRPRAAVAAAKRAVYEGTSTTLARGMHVEQAAFMAALSGPAAARGVKAYVEDVKRTGDLTAFDPHARKAYTDVPTST